MRQLLLGPQIQTSKFFDMARRRYGKNYRKRRRSRSRKTRKSFAARVKKVIHRSAEKKLSLLDSDCTIVKGIYCGLGTETPLVHQFYQISHGVNDLERVGDQITLTGGKFHVMMLNNPRTDKRHGFEAYPHITWRVLFLEMHSLGVSPVNDLWETATYPLAARTLDKAKVKRVYIDRTFTINASGIFVDEPAIPDVPYYPGKQILKFFYPKVRGKVSYNDNAPAPNRIIQLFIFNDAIQDGFQIGAVCEVGATLTYTDV